MARKPTRYLTKELIQKDEFVLEDSVFRKVPQFPSYFVSDRGEVISTCGKLKILHGCMIGSTRKYALHNRIDKPKPMSDDLICAMAFD